MDTVNQQAELVPSPEAMVRDVVVSTGSTAHSASSFHELETLLATKGNLEASVRSRDAIVGRARRRDLIEAGLSEPAGWRRGLWGLCCRRLGRDTRSAVRRAAFERPLATGGKAAESSEEVGAMASSAIRTAAAVDRIAAVL